MIKTPYAPFGFLIVLVGLLIFYSGRQSLENMATIICFGICFLGILALTGWQNWLDFQMRKELREKLQPLEKACEDLKCKNTELSGELEKMRTAPKIQAQELLQLAEKTRAKVAKETKPDGTVVKTVDKMSTEIRDFIIENFPKQ